MLTHVRAAAAPRRVPHSLPLQPNERGDDLVDSLDPVEDEEHILVLGNDGPDLMCALLRAGARQVTHVRSHEHLEADSVSLVLVPQVRSLEWLASVLPQIRRVLVANGRLIVCLPAMLDQVRRLLILHGFSVMRLSRASGRQMLSAEVPAFGIRRYA